MTTDPYANGWNNAEERTKLSIVLDILRTLAVTQIPRRRGQNKVERAEALLAKVYQELCEKANRDQDADKEQP